MGEEMRTVTDDLAFKKLGASLSNWGRWGTDDELGTVNHITDERRRTAMRSVRTGKIFDLGIPLDADGPQCGGNRFNPIHKMSRTPADGPLPDGMVMSDDIVILPLQCSTQWDGLCHVGYDGMFYNGVPTSTVIAAGGARQNSFHRVAPHLIGRGVLLDVARHRGVAALQVGDAISAGELSAVASAEQVEPGPGDILMVRTGWYRHFLAGDSHTYLGQGAAPGLDLSCCSWLAEHEIAAIASDNWLVEITPTLEPSPAAYPFHCVMIRDVGMTLGEMFNLEELAEQCAATRTWDFVLSAVGLKVTGSVGTPLTPVAIS